MATYFHGGSEIQADNLQTLYLMNPNYVTYSDHQPPPQQPQNMLVLNAAATAASGSHALNPGCIPYGQPQSHQQFVGIPLSGSVGSESDDPSRPSPSSLQSLVPRVHYNLWTSVDPANCGPDVAQQMGFRRPQPGHHQQGLSLTLSAAGQNPVTVVSPRTRDEASVSNGGVAVPQSGIIGSKYLKAAQELLDEVVHVGKGVQKGDLEVEGGKEKVKTAIEAVAGEVPCGGGGGESKRAAELTTAQRQELQMKKAKLLSMLDEVEQRYRQYHAQMQMVVAAFEQVAGPGSAKSYTALALQTISKQFRCLKDAITTQIKGTSKSLGEMEVVAKVEGSSSRLKFVDHQLRQQRALQQLGMIQHNAWRPQRGLPERAVSVLRAWLFEHFLHPYPKDSDKHMLAKQTGLTRSQVSNWFINARVRLWKPMVEEMYTEEMKHQAHDPTGSASEPATTDPSKDSTVTLPTGPPPKPPQDHRETPPIHHTQNPNHSTNSIPNITVATSPQGFSLIGSASDVIKESTYMETMMQRSPKRNRTTDQMHNSPSSILSMDMEIKPTDPHHPHHHHHHHHQHQMGAEQRHHAVTSNLINSSMGFNTYPPHLSDIGRFNGDHLAHRYHHGNGVSLTLGLPHCENLSLAGTQQNYLPSHTMQLGRMDGGGGEPDFCGLGSAQPSHSSVGYESIDIQNRKRFAAQLLPDFVA